MIGTERSLIGLDLRFGCCSSFPPKRGAPAVPITQGTHQPKLKTLLKKQQHDDSFPFFVGRSPVLPIEKWCGLHWAKNEDFPADEDGVGQIACCNAQSTNNHKNEAFRREDNGNPAYLPPQRR